MFCACFVLFSGLDLVHTENKEGSVLPHTGKCTQGRRCPKKEPYCYPYAEEPQPSKAQKSKATKEKLSLSGRCVVHGTFWVLTSGRGIFLISLSFLSNRPDNERRLYVKGNSMRHKKVPRELLLLIFVIG